MSVSLFASRNLKTIEVPLSLNADGDTQQHTITIRQLNPKQLEACGKEAQRVALMGARELGGFAAIQKDLEGLKKGDGSEPDADDVPNPFMTLDRTLVIVKGLKEWSLAESISEANIEDLPLAWQTFAGTEILKHTNPSLVQSKNEREAARKNA